MYVKIIYKKLKEKFIRKISRVISREILIKIKCYITKVIKIYSFVKNMKTTFKINYNLNLTIKFHLF